MIAIDRSFTLGALLSRADLEWASVGLLLSYPILWEILERHQLIGRKPIWFMVSQVSSMWLLLGLCSAAYYGRSLWQRIVPFSVARKQNKLTKRKPSWWWLWYQDPFEKYSINKLTFLPRCLPLESLNLWSTKGWRTKTLTFRLWGNILVILVLTAGNSALLWKAESVLTLER